MEIYTLSNNLRIVMEGMKACRSVSIGIWVKTGSRFEQKENNGVAHFIEHMLFKGTRHYTAQQIADIFDGLGGYVNAFTSKEYTCFFAKVLDEHLSIAVEVLSEMISHSLMDEGEFEKERNVILEEILMCEDLPDDLVHDHVAKVAFGPHALSYPILGYSDTIRSIERSEIKRFMQQHYHASNMVISVAGNIQVAQTLTLLEQYFGQIPSDNFQSNVEAPEFIGGKSFHYKQAEQDHICLSFPGFSHDDPQLFSMVLLNNLIGGTMSSRLFQEVREERGLAYSVYSYHSTYIHQGLFTIYAGTVQKHSEQVIHLIFDLLDRLQKNGLSKEELLKGKEQMKGSLILSLESTDSRMNRNGKNELMMRKHDSLDDILEKINHIQMDDIEAVMNRVFRSQFALSVVGHSENVLNAVGGKRIDLSN